MGIRGEDQRRVIRPIEDANEFNSFPLTAVTAIDTVFDVPPEQPPYGGGSGVVIAPNYVLTAAHVVYDYSPPGAPIGTGTTADQIRVTTSANATPNNLIDRRIGTVPTDPGPNVNVNNGIFYPVGNANRRAVDIALLRTDNKLLDAEDVVGLIAFVDPATSAGNIGSDFKGDYFIQTAGYPSDNVSADIENNSGLPTRDLALAPGEGSGKIRDVINTRVFQYTDDIDTARGQSGSGVWHTLEGDTTPRVLGIHNSDLDVGAGSNAGALIDIQVYNSVIAQTEDAIDVEDPNDLPENAIIGTDFYEPEDTFRDPPAIEDANDTINGTYRRERILGLGGDDTIFGEGANDRLEGNEGDDDLDGGTGKDIITGGPGNDLIDGGTDLLATINPFDRENDVAVYSAPISEYNIEIDTSGGLLGSPIGGETVTTITHLNGGIDGQDTLTNIEILVFSDGAVPLSSDDDIIDDLLNFFGGSEDDNIVGNILDNQLRGEAGNDTLDGKAGDDDLDGGIGDDTLIGGMGNDTLKGSANRDYLTGDEDNDVLIGGAGNDTLFGSTGKDNLNGNNNNDVLYGGAGNDTLRGNFGRDYLRGDEENDVLIGGAGNDTLRGDSGRDYLRGDEEDDVLIGGADNDTLFGGTGKDNLNGNNNNDVLFGGAGNDTLRGNFGRDYLKGDEGNDVLIGGADGDILFGGTGRDFFSLQNIPSGVDEIRDFELNGDKIGLGSISYDAIALRGDNNTTLSYNGRDFAVLLGIDSNSLNSTHFS